MSSINIFVSSAVKFRDSKCSVPKSLILTKGFCQNCDLRPYPVCALLFGPFHANVDVLLEDAPLRRHVPLIRISFLFASVGPVYCAGNLAVGRTSLKLQYCQSRSLWCASSAEWWALISPGPNPLDGEFRSNEISMLFQSPSNMDLLAFSPSDKPVGGNLWTV